MELKKVDSKNVWKIVKLSVKEDQSDFVATNTESILEAYTMVTSDEVALPFGIYDGDMLVGFVMFGYDAIEGDPDIAKGNYCIVRFMIDKEFQGVGFGKKGLQAAIDYVKSMPCGEAEYCWLSYEPENVAARSLYHAFGFVENGEMCEEEIVAVLKL